VGTSTPGWESRERTCLRQKDGQWSAGTRLGGRGRRTGRSVVSTQTAQVARRIFKFALNHCITGQLIAMRLGPLAGYVTIAQVRSGISNRRGFVRQSVISCIAAGSWPCGPAGRAILAHTLFGAKPTKTDTLPTITRGCRAVLRVNSPIDLSDAASGQFVSRRQLPVKIE
jgi:hypothetical protein